jgi:hypothetical protein
VISGLPRRRISEKGMCNNPAYRAKKMKQRSERRRSEEIVPKWLLLLLLLLQTAKLLKKTEVEAQPSLKEHRHWH